MSAPAVIVFGIGSDASVEQWDGCRAVRGVMLRWFLPTLDLPPLGFDVYRGTIPDIPPLPFDDINVAAVSGKPNWDYAGIVTLSCASGLTFEPSARAGWNRLVITPNAPVRVRFRGSAWRIQVRAETVGAGVDVTALVDGAETLRQKLAVANAQMLWRSRDVSEIVLNGEGTITFIGFHLLDDPRFWTHIKHRCLPVHDPRYSCGPAGAVTEEDDARMRLPADAAAKWSQRFADPFKKMLPALHRLACGEAAAAIPPDSLDPLHPQLTAADGTDERALIRVAMLDPHVARMLGFAYDDLLALSGQELAYKVAGIWRGARHEVDGSKLKLADFVKLLTKAGVKVKQTSRDMSLNFPAGALDFQLTTDGTVSLEWGAEDDNGHKYSGRVDRKQRTVSVARLVTLRLAWGAGRIPTFTGATWYLLDRRVGVLPSVYARELGPPVGPASLAATVQPPTSPSGIASAALDWPLAVGSDGSTAEGGVISYQVGRRLLGPPNGANAPATGPASSADVLRPLAPIYLSQQAVTLPSPRTLHVDYNDGQGLPPGWWGWWVRGVDLFGRVSSASSWSIGRVDDVAPPPAPVLVQGEWVQRSLPAMTVAVLGRSVEASRWLTATADDDPAPEAGLVAAWTLPPEQADLRDDIDGFRVFLRNAAPKAGAAADAPLVYPDWPVPIARFGPLQIVSRGAVESVTPDPSLTVDLTDGGLVSEAPRVPAVAHNARTAYRTSLTLDGASGMFVGGTLALGGGRVLKVVANSDGPNLIIVVEHAPNAPPPANSAGATLRAAAGALVLFDTDVPDLQRTAGLTPRCGLLVDEQAVPARYPVLRKSGSELLCVNPPPDPPDGVPRVAPQPGNALTWYPVWFAAVSNTGFGPVANAQTPVANAQIAVQSLRRVRTQALASAYSATLTVTAVDVSVPDTPTITAIPFDPEDRCAMLASRADWYGNSRFTFSWSPQANCVFSVYRALADEVFRLDRGYMSQPNSERDLAPERWPLGVFDDPARKARVEAELAELNDALDDDPDNAYTDLCIDTQMFLGLQAHAWAGFTPLFGRPISTTSYTDTLNGRTRAHWFYAVTARSLAGIESAPSTISPPICCPDVVPPAPPLAHSALAAEGAVKLKWLASPDSDTHHYEIYAARTADVVANLDALTPVPSYAIDSTAATATPNYTPTPHVSGTIIERFVARARNEMGEWCFWIVATDTAGNRSEPSRMLRGRALLPPPTPPTWVSAERRPAGAPAAVSLTWSHPTDSRLSSQIERRVVDGFLWVAITPWLTRGIYEFTDIPPDLSLAWEYRLRVRDQLGQMASELPIIALAALP